MPPKIVVVGAGGIGMRHILDICAHPEWGRLYAILDISSQVLEMYRTGELYDAWQDVVFPFQCDRDLLLTTDWNDLVERGLTAERLHFLLCVPPQALPAIEQQLVLFPRRRVFVEKPGHTALNYDMVGYPLQFLDRRPSTSLEMHYAYSPQGWRLQAGVFYDLLPHALNILGWDDLRFEYISFDEIVGSVNGVSFSLSWRRESDCDVLLDGCPYSFDQAFVQEKAVFFGQANVPHQCRKSYNDLMLLYMDRVKNAVYIDYSPL